MPVFVLVLVFLRVFVFMPVPVLVSVSSALGLVVPLAFGFCCNTIAAPAQQQHCNTNSSIAATTLAQHCSNSSKNSGPTGGTCTNSWAIHATKSQSLVPHMVWGPWGPKTYDIHNFPCVFNDKQTYSILPKGSQGLPPKCSLMEACW